MPSSISKARLHKAFNEGRRSATSEAAQNPYDNPKLRRLWEQGRERQRAGEIETPIPPLRHGETRARQMHRNPPGSKPAPKPAARRPAPGPGDSSRFGGRGRPRGR